MFLDASAMIGILADEPERAMLQSKVDKEPILLTSALAVYEATLGLARLSNENFARADQLVRRFVADMPIQVVPIDEGIGSQALEAFRLFGKGRHKAKLNMGDCFSYACAKVHGVPLLFKGDDFVHTDIMLA
jgi:ribonuclease VapC